MRLRVPPERNYDQRYANLIEETADLVISSHELLSRFSVPNISIAPPVQIFEPELESRYVSIQNGIR